MSRIWRLANEHDTDQAGAHLVLVARARLAGSLRWHVEALIHIVLDLNSQH